MKRAARMCLLVSLAVTLLASYGSTMDPNCPRNIILVISDGMGVQQELAAEYLMGRPPTWQDATFKGMLETASTTAVTDSAASATAMSTGQTVNNRVVAQRIPGSGDDLETSLEFYRRVGQKLTGMVTNTYVTHATPASFAAHSNDRRTLATIFNDYLTSSRPNVIFGGGHGEVDLTAAGNAGYLTASTKAEMDTFVPGDTHTLAAFGTNHMPYEFDQAADYDTFDYPHLHEMATKALELLNTTTVANEGFFLMLECGRVDHAGHANRLDRLVYEMEECDKAVQVVKDFTLAHAADTFLVVTSDHETGGLHSLVDNGPGNVPGGSFLHGDHTAEDVNIYAYGEWGSSVDGVTTPNEAVYELTLMADCYPTPQATPSPSSVSSTTPSASSSVSWSASPSPSSSFSPSESASRSESASISRSRTISISASPSVTPTATLSRSSSVSVSPTISVTPSTSVSPSQSPTASPSSSRPITCTVSISFENTLDLSIEEAGSVSAGYAIGYNVLYTGQDRQVSVTVTESGRSQQVDLDLSQEGADIVEFALTGSACLGGGYFLSTRPEAVAPLGFQEGVAALVTLRDVQSGVTVSAGIVSEFFALPSDQAEVLLLSSGMADVGIISASQSLAQERVELFCLALDGGHQFFASTPLASSTCSGGVTFVTVGSSSSDSRSASTSSSSTGISLSESRSHRSLASSLGHTLAHGSAIAYIVVAFLCLL